MKRRIQKEAKDLNQLIGGLKHIPGSKSISQRLENVELSLNRKKYQSISNKDTENIDNTNNFIVKKEYIMKNSIHQHRNVSKCYRKQFRGVINEKKSEIDMEVSELMRSKIKIKKSMIKLKSPFRIN